MTRDGRKLVLQSLLLLHAADILEGDYSSGDAPLLIAQWCRVHQDWCCSVVLPAEEKMIAEKWGASEHHSPFWQIRLGNRLAGRIQKFPFGGNTLTMGPALLHRGLIAGES